MLKTTALKGVVERLKGGSATRMQALVGAIAAGAAVYKLLRSGGGEEEEATEPEGPTSTDDGSPAASKKG